MDAGKSTSVAEKAAAIDAAQAHPPTWQTVVKRALPVAVAGAAIYLVLPKLIVVLGAWPRLSTLNPIWFAVALAAEIISFTCNFALQRLALAWRRPTSRAAALARAGASEHEQQAGAGRRGLPSEVHRDQAREGGDEPDKSPTRPRRPGPGRHRARSTRP